MVLLPMSVQFVHSFENHEENLCQEEYIQHIHEKELNCEFNHNTYHSDAALNLIVFNVESSLQILSTPISITTRDNGVQLFSKSSRAPPLLFS